MATANGPDTAPLTHGDVVILDYLAALWAESDGLAPEVRDDLMATVVDYVARRRAAVSDPLADPGQILGRLGPPESLVAAARRGHRPYHLRLPEPVAGPPVAPVRADPAGPVEFSALALLTAGAVLLPVIGPYAGLLLASGSSRWSAAQKTLAWILTTASAGFAAVLLLAAAAAVTPGFGLLVGYLAAVAGPGVSAAVLAHGLSRRP